MEVSIGQAGIRLLGAYSSSYPYMVAQAVTDSYGNWWYSKKGTEESPNKGNPLPTIKNGKQTASEWWLLMINVQDSVEKAKAAETAAGSANTAAGAANSAKAAADAAAAYADAIAKNPPKIGDDGFWYFYDYSAKSYKKPDYVAKGGVEFPTISVDTSTMMLMVENNSDSAKKFSIDDETGTLCINL